MPENACQAVASRKHGAKLEPPEIKNGVNEKWRMTMLCTHLGLGRQRQNLKQVSWLCIFPGEFHHAMRVPKQAGWGVGTSQAHLFAFVFHGVESSGHEISEVLSIRLAPGFFRIAVDAVKSQQRQAIALIPLAGSWETKTTLLNKYIAEIDLFPLDCGQQDGSQHFLPCATYEAKCQTENKSQPSLIEHLVLPRQHHMWPPGG